MTAPNHALLVTLLAVFTACAGYAVGRLHQWYRTGLDRDEAYRDGYETATRSVFSTAARLIAPRRAARGTAAVSPVVPVPPSPDLGAASSGAGSAPPVSSDFEATPPVPAPVSRTVAACTTAARASDAADGEPGGRHLVPDELVRAPTYRLAPDRVARAKVREVPDGDDEDQETTRLPSVPRPRSS